MIETTKQTVEALKEIKELTEWSNERMAQKIGAPGSTIHRILSGENKNPTTSTMNKIDAELKRVKKIHG
jgi:transcriptional regulator with XRE-family HTH domain